MGLENPRSMDEHFLETESGQFVLSRERHMDVIEALWLLQVSNAAYGSTQAIIACESNGKLT